MGLKAVGPFITEAGQQRPLLLSPQSECVQARPVFCCNREPPGCLVLSRHAFFFEREETGAEQVDVGMTSQLSLFLLFLFLS